MPAGYTAPSSSSRAAGVRIDSSGAAKSAEFAGIAENDPAMLRCARARRRCPWIRQRGRWSISARRPPPSRTTRKSPSRRRRRLLRANQPAVAVELLKPAAAAVPQLGGGPPHVGGGPLPDGRLQIVPSCTPASTFVGQVKCAILPFNGMYVGEARTERVGGSPLPPGSHS